MTALLILLACGGSAPSRGPLFMATPEPGTSSASGINVQTVENTISVSGKLEDGCPASGEYVVDGGSIDIVFHDVSQGACRGDSPAGMFVTRVGPLSPGRYRVTVRVGSQALVSGQAVRIG
ncbi:MAG: hypothetical protein ABI613_05215 [Gemmatimonadota bacterium]